MNISSPLKFAFIISLWSLLWLGCSDNQSAADNGTGDDTTVTDDTDQGNGTDSTVDSATDSSVDSATDSAQLTDTDTAVDRSAMFNLVDQMGACVNLGNWLEAPNEDWGVVCDKTDFDRIAAMGFETIRMPVRWESRTMDTPPYTIDEAFLDKVETALGWATDAGLNVVMDMHHHEALFADAAGTKEQFMAQWTQVADRFKDQPQSVLFEILNEPHDTLTESLWNEYLKEALAIIRQTNPTRPVVVGTANWGGIGSMNALELPADDNIIFTFHYYDPFQFTHQGAEWVDGADAWLGTRWSGTYLEKLQLKNDMAAVTAWSDANDIPVFMGEFGSYSTAPIDDRARWTEAVARFAEEAGFSWCYWEYKAGFGLYDENADQWNAHLTDALFSTDNTILQMDPAELGTNLLVNGDFENGLDSWRQNFFAGDATASAANGALDVEISALGDAEWTLQVIQDLVPLKADQNYAVLFEASADAPRSLSVGVQHQADPWTTYAYNTVSIGTEPTIQVLNFTMTTDDDAVGLVFNLGAATDTVHIDNVLLVETN